VLIGPGVSQIVVRKFMRDGESAPIKGGAPGANKNTMRNSEDLVSPYAVAAMRHEFHCAVLARALLGAFRAYCQNRLRRLKEW
jgi:hypothetical protein